MRPRRRTRLLIAVLAAAALIGQLAGATPTSSLANTPAPTSVTVAGSFDSEIGCAGDWDPSCSAAHLAHASSDVWRKSFPIPAGAWGYKAALNDSWTENYGSGGVAGGDNIALNLAADRSVTFYYDHRTHWVTDNVNSTIVTAPGSYQSEIGCSGDWQPECLQSWLEDPDANGVYTFTTTGLPAGNYEVKAALDESWDVNYGAGGVQNGANIPFHVSVSGAKVVFSYVAATHVLSVAAGHALDNNVEWDGLGFDSRDTLYRTPQGAVAAGTPVTIRFRTFHDDVAAVRLRVFDVAANAQQILPMTRAANDVSCYDATLAAERCDFWQTTLTDATPDVIWYRFIIQDGTATAYYADDTSALDGGRGVTTGSAVDYSYALTVYDPSFTVPGWAANAVVYQIFPDRFRDADRKNDPPTGTTLYDEQAVLKPWNAKPEGYCRSYDTPCSEGPHGVDFFGGDLKGIRQKLEWIHDNGFNTIYLNPIFWAKSNHRYDTADYLQIDPFLGDQKDFEQIVKQAHELGMHIILDGVFNHMSSDSPNFDRYHHYPQVGACESLASPYRNWFVFTDEAVPCGSGDYVGWFGFDSIPVLKKANPAVQSYFLTGSDSVATHWLRGGADGWRLDVMGDPSFPSGYWQTFRRIVKQADPDALIIGELWQKDSTLLRLLDGDAADSTMNYRLRDAVLGLLGPQGFDAKGFGDSGHSLTPSQFAARLLAQQEDYAPQVYRALLNLIDSHDTARALWDLTPGAPDTVAKESNPANLAQGKQRLRLASLIQYTLPGMPTVYYGDEVGVTGADDPDNRRTYPWPDTGGTQDRALLAHYQSLAALRSSQPELRDGDLRVLATDDTAGTIAYGRKNGSRAAIIAINRSGSPRTMTIPVAGWLPNRTALAGVFGAGRPTNVSGGTVSITLGALSGAVLATGTIDLTPPAAPTALNATGTNGSVALTWNAVAGATAYNVYHSPVTGGGFVLVNTTPVTATNLTDTGLRNAQRVYYVVRALDATGNESRDSNEVAAIPHLTIGWANTQWPPSMEWTISTFTRTDSVYGQVWIDGVTNAPGPTDTLRAQLGFGAHGSDPAANVAWTWVEAAFNGDRGNNDEFVASMQPTATGSYDYAYRYTTDDGVSWTYADLDGIGDGYSAAQAGQLTVKPSSDTTPPGVPTGLHTTSASPSAIALAWNAVSDADVAGYEVARATSDGGPFIVIGSPNAAAFTDTTVSSDTTYWYVVRAFDTSFNRSAYSDSVSATAALRTVHVVFHVTVPSTTDATARSVYLAGSLSVLDGGLPDWNPGGVILSRVDATHWIVQLSGREATEIQYKYTLGDWDHVEKGAACDEIANRTLTLSYGSTGTQDVYDSVLNWRNVVPCGN